MTKEIFSPERAIARKYLTARSSTTDSGSTLDPQWDGAYKKLDSHSAPAVARNKLIHEKCRFLVEKMIAIER